MNRAILKKTAAVLTALLFVASYTPVTLQAKSDISTVSASDLDYGLSYTEQNTYSDYYDLHINDERPDEEIKIRGCDYKEAVGGSFSKGIAEADNGEKRDNTVIWDSNSGSLTYEIEVEKGGIYNMYMSYLPLVSNTTITELSILIDGEIPFDTAARIRLNKVWVNEREITIDSRGNQTRPAQIQTALWREGDILDADGLFSEPLGFYLEKGRHTITFDSSRANISIEYFKLYNKKSLSEYESVSESELNAVSGQLIRLEGELADYKSSSNLYPTYDNGSYLASPSNAGKIVYNTIGADNWQDAGQSITWNIGDDVKESGWYKIGIKARQTKMRGFYSNRRIYIDGKVVCSELDGVKFYYDTEWSTVSPKTEDGDYIYVYLTAGEEHTLTLEAVPGEIGGAIRRLNGLVLEINEYYRKVLMVTGPNPDKYTDYSITAQVQDIVERFTALSAELKAIKADIEALSGAKGSEASGIERMFVLLDKCLDNTRKIPQYMGQLKDNVTAISSWMADYRDQPLELDYVELATADMKFTGTKENPFKSLAFGAKAFFNSFTEDYSVISEEVDSSSLDVWVQLGRDQALVVKELVESDFMQEHDIGINISLVQGGVVEATLANKGPDVALFLGGEFPVNLAARDLLVDVSQFPDYDEVASRFGEDASVLYAYNGGTYGVPLTQNFAMMFYRKDVLAELGVKNVPQTWDELIKTLPALQRNYMSAGLVLPPANISVSTEPGHTFATLLLQNGLNYYNDDLTATCFDNIKSVQSFEKWTDFYVKYKFEQTYDAFSYFRTGRYPIVIQPYTFYNQLKTASPEIDGLWGFAPVPGTAREDGTISHATNSAGSGAVIFSKLDEEKRKDAWEFVKWFTSAEVQTRYATAVEGLMGTLGRVDSANTETLLQSSWSQDELELIMAQKNELEAIPVIPAAYSVTRDLMNAFRTTVNERRNPRDTLIWYNKDINREITRKRENLGT